MNIRLLWIIRNFARCIPPVVKLVKSSEAVLNCCDIFPDPLLPVKMEENQRHQDKLAYWFAHSCY